MSDKDEKPLDRGKVSDEIETEIAYWKDHDHDSKHSAIIALRDLQMAINSGRLDVEPLSERLAAKGFKPHGDEPGILESNQIGNRLDVEEG